MQSFSACVFIHLGLQQISVHRYVHQDSDAPHYLITQRQSLAMSKQSRLNKPEIFMVNFIVLGRIKSRNSC